MPFPTQTEVQAGLDAYNRFVARMWSAKLDEIGVRLRAELAEALRKHKKVLVVDRVQLQIDEPPRLEFEGALAGPGRLSVRIRLPGNGSWTLRVRVRLKGLLASHAEVQVRRLNVNAELELERTTSFAARLLESRVKVAVGDVKVTASNFLVKIFSKKLNVILDLLESTIEGMVRKQLAQNLPDPKAVRAIEALGLAGEPLDVVGAHPDLAEFADQARAVSSRIARAHTPWDTVLIAAVPRADPDATPVRYRRFEDSAIWTGHFLAGEVMRFHVTRDTAALDNIRKMLNGLASLIRLTDEPGLLCRVQVPISETATVQALDAGHGSKVFTSIDGHYRALGHITRDQYIGAFLGTALAAELLPDGDTRDSARDITRTMASYLVRTCFCPTEATADPETGRKFTSVTYVTSPGQVLAILQAAQTVDASFKAEFTALFPIWSIVWFFNWFDTLDPNDNYFKFNLEHGASFLLLFLEKDPQRRAQLALGLQATRWPIRFHAQAWFNLVELATLRDEELSRPRTEIERETRQLIADMFQRPPYILPSDLSADPTIEKVTYAGMSGDGETQISRRAVAVPRRPGADFLWQRSPFALNVAWKDTKDEDPAMRSPNVDIVLPYWVARHIGL